METLYPDGYLLAGHDHTYFFVNDNIEVLDSVASFNLIENMGNHKEWTGIHGSAICRLIEITTNFECFDPINRGVTYKFFIRENERMH